MRSSEAEAFRKELINLIGIKHPNFRRVVGGGIDEIDNIGFVATRWSEGRSVSQQLKGGHYLDPSAAVLIVKQALELMIHLESRTHMRISMSPQCIFQDEKDFSRYSFWISLHRVAKTKASTMQKEFFDELVNFLNSVLRRATIIGENHYCRLRGWMDMLSASGFTYEEALRALPEAQDTLTPLPGMTMHNASAAIDATHVLGGMRGGKKVAPPSRPQATIKKTYQRHNLWKKELEAKERRKKNKIYAAVLAVFVIVAMAGMFILNKSQG